MDFEPNGKAAQQDVIDSLMEWQRSLKVDRHSRESVEYECQTWHLIHRLSPTLSRNGPALSCVEHAGMIFVALPPENEVVVDGTITQILKIPIEGCIKLV